MEQVIKDAIELLTEQLEQVEKQIEHTDYPAVFFAHRDKLIKTIRALKMRNVISFKTGQPLEVTSEQTDILDIQLKLRVWRQQLLPHEMGHCYPVRVEDVDSIIDFIADHAK